MIFICVAKAEETIRHDAGLLQVMHLGIGPGKVVEHPARLDICVRVSYINLENWKYFNTFGKN